MDAVLLPEVEGAGHSAARNEVERLLLCLEKVAAQRGRVHSVVVGRYLHEVERCAGVLEALPHHTHVGRLQARVLLRAVAVALALVPQHSLEGERHQRRYLPVPQHTRRAVGILFRRRAALEVCKHEFAAEAFPQRGFVHPGLDRCAAPVGDQQSHGDAQHLVELPGEEVRHRARVSHGLRRVLFPGAGAAFQRRRRVLLAYRAHTYRHGRFRAQNHFRRAFYRLPVETAHRHFHIGLAGAEPHLADEHVADGGLIAVAEADAVGASGGRSGDAGHPFAVAVRRRRVFCLGPGGAYGDGAALVGPSPHGHVLLLLQDHIVGEERREGHFGRKAGLQGCCQKEDCK